ncbi:MAG: GH32 C-terminal domain-containing protein, partial [Chthoniobacteraceae bacterium]
GGAFYAAQTFTNVPDGRWIQIGWGRVPSPGMPFNQMMCFPTTLSLKKVNGELRMAWRAVKELEKLHVGSPMDVPEGVQRIVSNAGLRGAGSQVIEAVPLIKGRNPLEGMGGELLRIRLGIATGEAEKITLNVRGTPIEWDRSSGELRCGKARWKLASKERIRLDVLADRTSLEIFADDGTCYMVVPAIPAADNKDLSLTVEGEGARLGGGQVIQLKSAWRK